MAEIPELASPFARDEAPEPEVPFVPEPGQVVHLKPGADWESVSAAFLVEWLQRFGGRDG